MKGSSVFKETSCRTLHRLVLFTLSSGNLEASHYHISRWLTPSSLSPSFQQIPTIHSKLPVLQHTDI